jgi:tetratricopeptide (TPR) repeat protein
MTGGECTLAMRDRDYSRVIDHLSNEGNTDDTTEEKRRELTLRCLAKCLSRVGRYEESVRVATELIDRQKRDALGAGDLCERAAALWSLSKRDDAVSDWSRALCCKYGDGAGNILPALQFYYAAVSLDSDSLRAEASAQISKRLSTGWSKNWPAPLGRFVVDEKDQEYVGHEILDNHPSRQPDEWCRYEFYQGAKYLEKQDLVTARRHFEAAVQRPNQVTWSTEFVLAMHECR